MATGTKANMKVYNEYIHTGVTEVLTQVADAMNGASQGAIRMSSVSRRGDYVYESMFQVISGLVSRRVTTGTAATASAADTPLVQIENVSVKLNRKLGPVANTMDSLRKIGDQGVDEDAMNLVLGQQAGTAMSLDMLNSALRAGRAALNATGPATTNKYTITSSGTLTTAGLVNGLAKLGDRADRVVCWIMHSKPYYDLVNNQISANIDGVSNFNVATATPVTLNRPVVVTDSAALVGSSGSPATSDYYTLGLVPGALEVEDSEETFIHSDIVTGLENLVVRYQGEFAYNLGVKGATWDVGNGGENPSDTAVATSTNWDPVQSSYKDYAGVMVVSK